MEEKHCKWTDINRWCAGTAIENKWESCWNPLNIRKQYQYHSYIVTDACVITMQSMQIGEGCRNTQTLSLTNKCASFLKDMIRVTNVTSQRSLSHSRQISKYILYQIGQQWWQVIKVLSRINAATGRVLWNINIINCPLAFWGQASV